MEKRMKITMFGGLRIMWGDTLIVDESTRINKPLELFVLLLQGRNMSISNEQLMERLWEDNEIENPAGALKNAVYSLRKLLRKIEPGLEFVLTEGHNYSWNKEIPLSLDLWEFEDIQVKLSNEQGGCDNKKQLELCRAAVKMYTGDFLPSVQSRRWVMQQTNYLRQMYLSDVLRISDILLESGDREKYSEALAVCNKALLLEPLSEELYVNLFRAMQCLDMRAAITSYYPVAANLFLDQLGVGLSASVRDIYLWASEGANQIMEDIRQIQQDLDEITRDTRPIRGAYYCEYEAFKHIYHMVVRGAVRDDNSVILMLFTLIGENGYMLTKEEQILAMLKLKEVIKGALRKGDVVSRYSRSQYVVMLSVVNENDSEIVKKRVAAGFHTQNPPPKAKLEVVSCRPSSIV